MPGVLALDRATTRQAHSGDLAANVRRLRGDETQRALCARSGVGVRRLRRIELGEPAPSDVLERLARAFRLPHAGYLLAPPGDPWWAFHTLNAPRKRQVHLLIATLAADARVTEALLCERCPAHAWWAGELIPGAASKQRELDVPAGADAHTARAGESLGLDAAARLARRPRTELRAACHRGELPHRVNEYGYLRIRRGDLTRHVRWPVPLRDVESPTVADAIAAWLELSAHRDTVARYREVLRCAFSEFTERAIAELDAGDFAGARELGRARAVGGMRPGSGAGVVERFSLWAASLELAGIWATTTAELVELLEQGATPRDARHRATLERGPRALAGAPIDQGAVRTLRPAIAAYLAAITAAGLSRHTIENRRSSLGELATLLDDDQALDELTPNMLDQWLGGLRARALSHGTIRGKRSNVAAFLTWCEQRRLIEASPMRYTLPLARASSVDDEYSFLSGPELARLLHHAISAPSSQLGTRRSPARSPARRLEDYLLCALMALAGLRVSEVCALDCGDVDAEQITVRAGKGNRRRRVPTDPALWEALERHRPPGRHLFGMERYAERRITRNAIEVRVARLTLEAGLPRATPHVLRHSFATRIGQNRDDLLALRDLLGHRSIETTNRYLHTRDDDRRGAMERARLAPAELEHADGARS